MQKFSPEAEAIIASETYPEQKRRRALRSKLNPTAQLYAAPEDMKDLPHSVDVDCLIRYSQYCIATFRNGCFVTHEPTVRFTRKCRAAEDGTVRYQDVIYFDVQCWERFHLEPKMQFSIFTDRRKKPQVILFQNVARSFDAPAHLHKWGNFTLHLANLRDHQHRHVCVPGTVTLRGLLRNASDGRLPMALMQDQPRIRQTWGRLWAVRPKTDGPPDLLMVEVADLHKIPKSPIEKAIMVQAKLTECPSRPREDHEFVRDLPPSVTRQVARGFTGK